MKQYKKDILLTMKGKKKLIIIFSVAFLLTLSFIVYKKISAISAEKDRLSSILETLQRTPASRTSDEKKILAKVSNLILLPQDEEPTLFTILNADALIKEQPFFVGSVNGDILLVYRQSQKAIIYSPTNRKIVNSGPIVSSLQTQTTKTETSPTQAPSKKK